MSRFELNMAKFQDILGQPQTVDYTQAADDRKWIMNYLLYDPEGHKWQDYSLSQHSWVNHGSGYETIASWLPLWADLTPDYEDSQNIVSSLQASGLLQIAGILTTNQETGQQWDAPNAWAPLVLMTIEALYSVNATELAVS